ncbi:MAG: DNA replication/repair protein RecF [Verrucomicrobiales bacterium]|nr:DNA replication/repair protein RecF [Verrucomicrobiales bacterium]
MHLGHLRMRDFRNYGRLDADFGPGFHVLLGRNAQGKTNLLEAVHLLATLRSFRGVGSAAMVRHGQPNWFVGGRVVATGSHAIKLYWSKNERCLTLDDQPIRKLTDYLGTLRTVAFCTEDLQLIKGAGRGRRRFLDFLLTQTLPTYLPLLQNYTRAVRSRNALLKKRPIDEASLESFTHEMVKLGNEIMTHRHALLPELAPRITAAHQRIAPDGEELLVEYQPRVKEDFAAELQRVRERERALGSTLLGPHRDELSLQLNHKPAADFASEGQKRTLAISLKLAQAEHLAATHGAPPILLIDDVMGELDAPRRQAFLPLLSQCTQGRGQVFMTCTEQNWPEELGEELQKWEVNEGELNQR